MSNQLPESIWSPEDLAELIGDLERYAQWLGSYQVKQHVAAQSAPTAPPTLSLVAVRCLEELRSQQTLNSENIEQLIARFKEAQDKAPRVHFTLAGPPSAGLKKSLGSWCRQHIAPDALVSFQFNATILGGMVVRYGSHIYDWSFRRAILANRGKFTEVLRRV